MNRRTAKAIHQTTNLTYWFENPHWDAGNPVANFLCKGLQTLPFSVHEAQKRAFFNFDKLLAVSGESVVVANGSDKVDKYMFRYPRGMALDDFQRRVTHEIGAVTTNLALALPTEVGAQPAYIFRKPSACAPAVAQTQARLNLDIHKPMDLPALENEAPSRRRDRTARDLSSLLSGVEGLFSLHGYYPDIARYSNNLRRNVLDGSVTLIDVMPIYADGNRLIGDKPPDLLARTVAAIEDYQKFVGQYGA